MMLQKTALPRAAQPRRGVGRVLKPFPAWSLCRQNKASDTIPQAQPQQSRAAQTKKGYLETSHEQLITSDLCLQKQEVVWKRRCRRCLSPWERHRPGDPSRASTARGNRALGWEQTHCGSGGFSVKVSVLQVPPAQGLVCECPPRHGTLPLPTALHARRAPQLSPEQGWGTASLLVCISSSTSARLRCFPCSGPREGGEGGVHKGGVVWTILSQLFL